MINNMSKVFDLMKDKKVFIFGTSPHINDILLDATKTEVISDTYIKNKSERFAGFSDLIVNLPNEKSKKLDEIFNSSGVEEHVSIGINLFSCYFPCNIAWWADKCTWLAREIICKGKANCYTTLKSTEKENKNYIDQYKKNIISFEWHGGQKGFVKNDIPLNYNGRIWWWRTGAFGALHTAALAKPRAIYISGVDLDPLVAHHFYETADIEKTLNWVNHDVIETVSRFPDKFPETKFYKTNPKSYLPFDYISFQDAINDKN